MNKKRFISWLLTASMLMPLGMFSVASAAEHTAGEHDFGDPFTPYLDTKLVVKDQIIAPHTISHTSKAVAGSESVTANIIESSAQFWTRDNGNGGLPNGEYKTITNAAELSEKNEYGNIKNKLFAYMYEPEADGKYPAVLFLHGGGGTADTLKERAKDFAAKGYVTMAIDIPALTNPTVPTVTVNGVEETRWGGQYIGNDNYRFNVTEEEGGAKNSNLVDAEVGVIQAFNYLAANTKVDISKMGIMGSSWGGYSTTLVAGILGDKVKAAYSQFGSGFYGPTPDGTKYESFWTDGGFYPTDEFAIEEWCRYLDPASHLDNLKANYYMDAAAKDTFFRPKSVEANLAKALSGGNAASVNHVWSYNRSHESISDSGASYNFMDYYLKNEGTAPSETEITKTILKGDGSNEVHIKVTASATPSWVQLLYSNNSAAYTDRAWKTMNASAVEGSEGEYTAVLPAEVVAEGVEYYALTKDADNAMYSSSLMKTGFTQKVSIVSTPSFKLDNAASYTLGKGEFTATVPVVNNDDADESDVRVILALYKNGALETTDISETTKLSAGEKKDISVSVNIADEDVTPYTAKILIWDSVDGMKPYSKTYNLASTDTAPTAPRNLKVASSTIDGIELVWDAAEDNIAVEGYYVYRKGEDDGDYTKIKTLSGNAASYTDDMVEVNENYSYAVSAFDASRIESDKAIVSASSIEGAKFIFDSYAGANQSMQGEKMSVKVITRDGSPVSLEENHKPLQDENTANCLKVDNAAGGTYIQLSIDDDYISSELDNKVAVMVTFDEDGFDNMRMQYNAADGNATKQVVLYKKVNEQRWMTKSYIIEDAAFANKGGFDLRLNFDDKAMNYIRMIQIVNLSEDFSQIAADAESITLSWKTVTGADAYNIYRDGELIAEAVEGSERTYTDEGLTIDKSYEYRLEASMTGATKTIGTITASTLKKYIAEIDYNKDTSLNMSATSGVFNYDTIDGVKGIVIENGAADYCFAVDSSSAQSKNYLVTFKYNDYGEALNMRVGMINSSPDRAHYFCTNGSGKWETATVLVPSYTFNNNLTDLTIRNTQSKKYALADVMVSECPSYDVGGYYLNGIVSGVTVADDMINSTMTAFQTVDQTSAEITEIGGVKAIKLNTDYLTNDDTKKRAAIKLVPDYRFLGQTTAKVNFPGTSEDNKRKDDKGNAYPDGEVRPITLKFTYYDGAAGTIYIKSTKLNDDQTGTVSYDHTVLNPSGSGEWKTVKVNIDDYYPDGNSSANTSPIQINIAGIDKDKDIIIGKVEITHRDYSTKVGEYSFADTDSAEALTASLDDGVEVKTYQNKTAAVINGSGKNVKFAVDKNVVAGSKDRLLTITYHDGGKANTPVRVSMINTKIDGAHYFYTRGTNRWETTTVLIPEAQFGGLDSDIQIRLVNADDKSLAISKVELYDRDSDGAIGATGIASGIVNYNGMFNSSLATWDVDEYTTLAPVTVDGVQAVKITSSNEDKNYRAEFKIVPDYRYLGTGKSGALPDGTVTPVTVRVTYYKGDGLMYVKGAKLSGNALTWTDNDGVVTFSRTSSDETNKVKVTNVDGNWVTAEVDIDNYFMNGGSDVFRSYIDFVTGGVPEAGAIIKSIEIINKTTD